MQAFRGGPTLSGKAERRRSAVCRPVLRALQSVGQITMSDAECFKRKVGHMIGDGDRDVQEAESVQEDEPGPGLAVPLDRWRALPARVRMEDQSSSVPASDAPDPDGGRNPDNDWLLRGV